MFACNASVYVSGNLLRFAPLNSHGISLNTLKYPNKLNHSTEKVHFHQVCGAVCGVKGHSGLPSWLLFMNHLGNQIIMACGTKILTSPDVGSTIKTFSQSQVLVPALAHLVSQKCFRFTGNQFGWDSLGQKHLKTWF